MQSRISELLTKFFLVDLIKGLLLTQSYLTKKKFTVQYPKERLPLKQRFRGALRLLYDPEHETLDPPLQVFRLDDGAYRRVHPGDDGAIESRTLGLLLRLDAEGLLDLVDPETGLPLLRIEQVREALAAEREARARAEEEIARLRRELAALRSD